MDVTPDTPIPDPVGRARARDLEAGSVATWEMVDSGEGLDLAALGAAELKVAELIRAYIVQRPSFRHLTYVAVTAYLAAIDYDPNAPALLSELADEVERRDAEIEVMKKALRRIARLTAQDVYAEPWDVPPIARKALAALSPHSKEGG